MAAVQNTEKEAIEEPKKERNDGQNKGNETVSNVRKVKDMESVSFFHGFFILFSFGYNDCFPFDCEQST